MTTRSVGQPGGDIRRRRRPSSSANGAGLLMMTVVIWLTLCLGCQLVMCQKRPPDQLPTAADPPQLRGPTTHESIDTNSTSQLELEASPSAFESVHWTILGAVLWRYYTEYYRSIVGMNMSKSRLVPALHIYWLWKKSSCNYYRILNSESRIL